jgi:hypothetical protein
LRRKRGITNRTTEKENIILAGDFNGRIPECMGTYGEQVMNHN